MTNLFKLFSIRLAVLLVAVTMLILNTSCGKSSDSEDGVVPEPPAEEKLRVDVTVAADGSGEFKKVQEAISAAPSNRTEPYVIFIKKGTYKEIITIESNKKNICLIGESADNTVLTYNNYASKLNPSGTEYGTSGSASVFIKGTDFVAKNITFENSSGDVGQALAVNISAARSAFDNCRFLGYQDTWYAANGTLQYMKDCYVAGTVDFMFGGSTAFFENCTLHSRGNGYLTAASTPQAQDYGYVYLNCKLTGEEGVKSYLGRPWRPDAKVVFLECAMDKHVRPEGWHNWGNAANEKTAFYAEYKSTGQGYVEGKRVAWSHQLTDLERKNYFKEKVLKGWNPFAE